MRFFNDKDKELNVFFLQDFHLELFRKKNIPLSALPYLLFHHVAEDDLIDIINFQRSIENKYFGRMFTTYKESGKLKYTLGEQLHNSVITMTKLEESYRNVKYYDEHNFLSVHCVDDCVIFGFSNKSYLEPDFKQVDNNVPKALYQKVLDILGYHQVYFREPVRGKDNLGIGIAELTSILTK